MAKLDQLIRVLSDAAQRIGVKDLVFAGVDPDTGAVQVVKSSQNAVENTRPEIKRVYGLSSDEADTGWPA
jgi:hypothetical protein